ncbi:MULTISPECIES: metal-dependent hydrolase [unclassified Psychrobacter]|uniref:metal-dependent hydrolase n=1 Tax=unclassified Psychrobacter TaxID=196806 RepID=UPI0025B61845|nr:MULTISPECIES: metal-dependent hydrolase [unclassified Psychrobacter]MDN3452003.1 metal-dependent hydrolase [Psychrobacter sp. APC 3350]MDN3501719.1 metal-dependent hydrolase [Psychrobacter sp. 5A.1]
MDSLSQIVLGASVQGAILGKYQGRKGYLYGAMLGTLPDLDVLINYPDPISNMTYHRGFSHSLIVLTAVGIVGAWAISRYHQWRNMPLPYSTVRLATAMTLALTTHPILDSFTVYGTQLLWPLQESLSLTPFSIASMFIIDPLYTLPLLIAMIVGLTKGSKLGIFKTGVLAHCQRLAIWMLVISSGYLMLSLGLKYYAQDKAEQTLAAAKIDNIVRIKTMPVLPTILMWRTVAEDDQNKLIEIRGSVLDSRLPEYRYLTQYDNSQTLRANLPIASQPYAHRLDWFSGDWTGYRTQTMLDDAAEPNKQDVQLVVDDLRMMAGDTAFFSFILANKTGQASPWQSITPIDAPIVKTDDKPEVSRIELVKQGFVRVFDESVVDNDGGWVLVDED